MVITSAFDFVAGYIKEKVSTALADTFTSPIFGQLRESLQQNAEAGATEAELALQRIPVAAGLAAEDIGATLGGSVDLFKKNLAESNVEFFNTEEQAKRVAEIQNQITTKVAETKAARELENATAGETVSLLESTVPLTAQISEDTQSQAGSLGSVNEQLTLSQQLEKTISGIKDENVSKTNSHAAAMAGVSNATGTASDNAKQFSSWLEYIEGTQPEEPVKKLSEKSADARREIEAFGQYIGTDLAGMSFPDIAKELGVDTLGKTGSQQIDAILDAVKDKLPDGKLTQPIDEKQSKKVISGLGKTLETDLKKSVDLALNGSDGSKILSELKTLVSSIKTAVEKIEPKLPQQALAY
jgi:hypothetical protein